MAIEYSKIIETTYFNRNIRDDLKHIPTSSLKNSYDNECFPYSLALVNNHGDLNIGTAIRSACLFGAKRVLVIGRNRFDDRSTVGAGNYIDIIKIPALKDDGNIDVDVFIQSMQKYSLTPIFCETGGEILGTFSWENKLNGINPCICIGNESKGFPHDILNSINIFPKSFTVSIRQKSPMRSLNAAVAASIIMQNLEIYYNGRGI